MSESDVFPELLTPDAYRLSPWYHRRVNETRTVPHNLPPTAPAPQRGRRTLRVVLLGGFGMQPKATMRYRALPLGQELAAAGCDVTMILPPWDCPADAGRVWMENGVRVVNVPLPHARSGPAFLAGLTRSLVTAVQAARPDVVHLFKPKGYGGLAALALRGLPLVVDHDDWEGAGGWNDAGGYTRVERALFGWQEHDLPRRAAFCTVASRTLETQLWAYGVPPARVAYLPNALRPDHAAWRDNATVCEAAQTTRERLGLSGPTVLLYTRFVEFAPERVAAIFAAVCDQIPGARLLVVGGGLRDEDDTARRAFAPLGDAVRWAGNVPFAELPGYLRAADVAFVPFADTPINRAKCSVKTCDLLALGVPIVATAVGENLSVIQGGETGVLVPPDDDHAAAAALVALLTDGDRAIRIAHAARAHAWAAQTWAAQIPAVLDIYTRVAHHTERKHR